MIQGPVISAIEEKLDTYVNNPVVLLKLLKILKVFTKEGFSGVYNTKRFSTKLKILISKSKSVLVKEMTTEIMKRVSA